MRRNLFGGALCALLAMALIGMAPATAGAAAKSKPSPKPGAPTNLSVIQADTALVVSWTAPAYTGTSPLTGYTVSVHEPHGHPTCTMTGATSCIATGLVNGTPSTFKIQAVNATNHGPLAKVSGIPNTVQNCSYVGPWANLQGCNLSYTSLAGDDLTGANLDGANLYADDVSGANLTHAGLVGTELSYDNLAVTDLQGATLAGADLANIHSGGVTGTPASLPTGWGVGGGFLMGPGVNLSYTDLSGVSFPSVDLTGATFWSSNLSGATLGAGTDFSDANLGYVNFNGADLRVPT